MSKNTKNEIAENVIENVIENVTENVIEDSSSIIYGWKIEQRAVGEPITFEDGRTLGLEWKGIPIGFDVSPDQVQTSFFKSPATERVRRLHDCGLMTYPEAMVHAWGFLATIDAQTDNPDRVDVRLVKCRVETKRKIVETGVTHSLPNREPSI